MPAHAASLPQCGGRTTLTSRCQIIVRCHAEALPQADLWCETCEHPQLVNPRHSASNRAGRRRMEIYFTLKAAYFHHDPAELLDDYFLVGANINDFTGSSF